jgi:fibronectin type 3 domain-containing protein
VLAGCGAVSQPEGAAVHYVSLTWNASSSATHYNVYRSEIPGGFYGLIGSTEKLTFTDLNIDSGTTFYYVCTAVDSAGRESAFSNEARATIPSE